MIHYDNDIAGIPYNDINWYDVVGQPFGTASYFNAIIFGDANNIVDTKGAMAVAGNFTSSRGLTLGYGNDGKLTGTGYSPDLVRFIVGGNVNMQGPLVVIGHVVAGRRFQAGKGSTYMIGKDGSPNQVQQLTDLYQAEGGSRYWRPSDRNTHYAISSYDVPRYIPAERIGADTGRFFNDALDSILNFHNCITRLQPNGTVSEQYSQWILRGTDPMQNVFVIDVRPNGLLNKEIHLDIPAGSLAIVILRTGNDAHLQYGLWGDQNHVGNTLYVFEDAENIYMEVPAAIWGSILAPRARFFAHRTGGTVFGNAALGSLMVNDTSGFEFHLFPFVGGVECRQAPEPEARPAPTPAPAPAPMPRPTPAPSPLPVPEARPETTPAPAPAPRPTAPAPAPTPEARPAPTPAPAPAPRPTAPAPAPTPEVRPTPPTPAPAPAPMPRSTPAPVPEARPTPTPPAPKPAPQPAPEPCPPCPECPEQEIRLEVTPIPVPMPCPEQDCRIIPGLIFGCIWGCSCCCNHEWIVRLYRKCKDKKTSMCESKISYCGCFEFEVPYDDFYLLEICPVRRNKTSSDCKPVLSLKNVGVANLMIL